MVKLVDSCVEPFQAHGAYRIGSGFVVQPLVEQISVIAWN
tara:strand:- start:757 stop:876 length:120 start_codon:yes stop_codon:yes gene_type:complete